MHRKSSNLPAVSLYAAALLFSISSPSTSQELRKSGRYYTIDITKSFDVQAGGELIIQDIRGDVEITTWSKSEVLIEEHKRIDVHTKEEAETVLERSKSSYHQTGNRIYISGENYRREWMQSRFVVSVPVDFNVSIDTRGGDIRVKKLDGEVNVETSGGDIDLMEIGGAVDAKTSGGDVTVRDARKRINVRTSGGDLDLSDIGDHITAKTSGGDIRLSRSKSSAELHTSGGDLIISDVGGELEAHTSGGDIEIRNTHGNTEVHTSGGDIELRNVGGRLKASTSGGDIDGTRIDGKAVVKTSGGEIDLRDVNGGVEARTAGGDISVKITLQDFSKPHFIDLVTAGGNIELYIPDKLPATIHAEIEITDRWDDYNIYSDFPLSSSNEEQSGRSRRSRRRRIARSEGKINGGGDAIDLRTTNGDIYIKKLSNF